MVDIDSLSLHPALERLKELRTERTETYRKAVFTPPFPLPCFGILAEEDAEAAGQPEHAGKLLSGHELLRVAKEQGKSEWKACHADIPPEVAPEEFIYRKILNRLDIGFGQKGIVGAMLQQFYEKEGREPNRAEKTQDVGHIEKNLLRAGKKVLEEAPGLAEQILRGEMNIQYAVEQLKKRSSNWSGPSPESVSLGGLLLGDDSGGKSQMDLFVGKLRMQYRQMIEGQE